MRLGEVLKVCNPDIICLQEVDTDENNLLLLENNKYKLADFSNAFIKSGKIYGLATFYNQNTFRFIDSEIITLPRKIFDIISIIHSFIMFRGQTRVVLKTEFFYKPLKKKIAVYNVHLSPFVTNEVRMTQVKKTLNQVNHEGKKTPLIITGDFNYPYGRKKFENLLKKHHLKEATNNLFFTFEGKILWFFSFKLKLDYILYKNILLVKTQRISITSSDHYPIVSRFKL